jgi:hypothetical protein
MGCYGENMKRIEFDNDFVSKITDELICVGHFWSYLKSPIVCLALKQTVGRLGGQVKIHPEPENVWDTDIEVAIIGYFIVAKLPCNNAELVLDISESSKLMMMYDRYFGHIVPEYKYDTIWNTRITTTTITPLPLTPTKVMDRFFHFIGPWPAAIAHNIIHQYEVLVKTFVCIPHSKNKTIYFKMTDVDSPTKQDDFILFPRNVVAGFWAKQFTLMAAALATTV